jgi:hypothetical protein
MAVERKLTAEGFRRGLQWVVDIRDPGIRASRATAFAYAIYGVEAFRDCSSLAEVCRRQRVSPRTFRNYLSELSALGLRWAPTANPSLPPHRADFSSENGEEAA